MRERGETIRLFVVVFVFALFGEFVIALPGSNGCFDRKIQLGRKLLHSVGLLNIAGLFELVELALHSRNIHVRRSTVVEGVQTAATDFVNLLDLRHIIGIPNVDIRVVRLHESRVQHVIVRTALVAETLTLQVHLEERLFAEPEPLADQVTASNLIRLATCAIERDSATQGVDGRTTPHSGLDAVSRAAAANGDINLKAIVPCLASLNHFSVRHITARCQDYALGGIHANIVQVVAIATNNTSHAARFILLAFHEHGVIANLGAIFDGVVAHGATKRNLFIVDELLRAMARSPCLVASTLALSANGAFEPHFEFAVALDDVGQPVNHVARFVDPQFNKVVIHEPVRITHDVFHDFHLIDFELREFTERFELVARINSTKVFAGLGNLAHLFDAKHARAIFGGGHKGWQATGAQTHDNDFVIERFGDLGFVDLRGFAKPARTRRTLGGIVFDGLVAFIAVPAARKGTSSGGNQRSGASALEEIAARYVTHWRPPNLRAGSSRGI